MLKDTHHFRIQEYFWNINRQIWRKARIVSLFEYLETVIFSVENFNCKYAQYFSLAE